LRTRLFDKVRTPNDAAEDAKVRSLAGCLAVGALIALALVIVIVVGALLSSSPILALAAFVLLAALVVEFIWRDDLTAYLTRMRMTQVLGVCLTLMVLTPITEFAAVSVPWTGRLKEGYSPEFWLVSTLLLAAFVQLLPLSLTGTELGRRIGGRGGLIGVIPPVWFFAAGAIALAMNGKIGSGTVGF